MDQETKLAHIGHLLRIAEDLREEAAILTANEPTAATTFRLHDLAEQIDYIAATLEPRRVACGAA